MANRRTWLWIVVGVAAGGLFLLVAVAGAGIYFVSQHVEARTSTGGEATSAFAAVASRFEGQRALYEVDDQDRPHLVVPLSSLPAAGEAPSSLMVQAWNPDDQKMIRLSLPIWLLRLGPDHVKFSRHKGDFDFDRLRLDFDELERIGSALVLDYRGRDGVRVLLWTE